MLMSILDLWNYGTAKRLVHQRCLSVSLSVCLCAFFHPFQAVAWKIKALRAVVTIAYQ